MNSKIMLEAAEELLAHPRLDAFDAFGQWILRNRAIELPPAETIVELVEGDTIDPLLAQADEAVGTFLVFDAYAKTLSAEFRVVLAVGEEDDDDEWVSRLTGMAHELLHVAQFWSRTGSAPARAASSALNDWKAAFVDGGLEGQTERQARAITARFLRAAPRWRRVP